VNLAGNAKVPPFQPCATPADLDGLRDLGFNVIRLLFVWEAYEPSPGQYHDVYVKDLRAIAAAAWERGMYVIVDFHQDGFSRFASRGAGAGFPRWAVSPRGRLSNPDNGPACKNWTLLVATDPTMHKSFADFFSDRNGVRTRYLAMLGRVAAAFAHSPGVIGYDLLNEPWGDERTELAPLYRDAGRVIHDVQPSAILFIEGHVTTSLGIQTRLPRPGYGPVAYAPHYYRPITIAFGRWHGTTLGMNRAFANMTDTARAWDTPLFLGEYGAAAETPRVGDYVSAIYDRLDSGLVSGTQWNYTPRWNPQTKDGWNAEDFNILDPSGALRPNFRPRPYPRSTAGTPLRFHYEDGGSVSRPRWFEFDWSHEPGCGETEIFVPNALFPAGAIIESRIGGVTCRRDLARQVIVCRAASARTIHLKVTAPADAGRLAAVPDRFGRLQPAHRGAG
jgi:endoglycosylceramidase